MRIGIHVRGFDAGKPVAVQKALEREAETIQIFASNPRQWRLPAVDPKADAELRRQMAEHDVLPLFIHAPYLVNLASPTEATREASFANIEWTMERAADLGAAGVIVHAGHCVSGERAMALAQSAGAMCRLVEGAPDGPRLLVELTAGAKGAIASRLPQMAELLDSCAGHPRLGICLDTCHLHAAGYDLAAPEQLIEELKTIGTDRLGLIHTNDSRDVRDSRRDRHAHIGEGEIGVEGFRALLSHPMLSHVPLICETPGEAAEDRRNIRLLKGLRDGEPAVARHRVPDRQDLLDTSMKGGL